MMKLMNVFLADDDYDDVEFFKDAVTEVNPSAIVTISKNGHQLLNLLSASITLPDIIFLDINMPLMNGVECLKEIKSDPRLQNIPVIILTTSTNPDTIEDTYGLRANLFVPKPIDYNELKSMINFVLEMDWSKQSSPLPLSEFIYK